MSDRAVPTGPGWPRGAGCLARPRMVSVNGQERKLKRQHAQIGILLRRAEATRAIARTGAGAPGLATTRQR
jgi:hypothetical protein